MNKEYKDLCRLRTVVDQHVWEKRFWGWKYLGMAKSNSMIDVHELASHDCDHPMDAVFEDLDD